MSFENIEQISFNSLAEVPTDYPAHFPPPVILGSKIEEIPKKIELELTPVRIRVKCKDLNNHVSSTKIISYQTLAKILAQELQTDTGFLHLAGDKYQGIRRIYSRGKKHLLVLEAKAQNRTVLYKQKASSLPAEEYQNIPFPYLVMFVSLQQEQAWYSTSSTRLYAMAGPLLREDQNLYNYPYANVFGDSTGNICWGTLELKINKLMDASSLINYFLNTPANGDLYLQDRAPLKEAKFDLLLSRLEKEVRENPEMAYPYHTLVDPRSYSSVINNLKF